LIDLCWIRIRTRSAVANLVIRKQKRSQKVKEKIYILLLPYFIGFAYELQVTGFSRNVEAFDEGRDGING